MESQHQNPEFRIHPENFHPYRTNRMTCVSIKDIELNLGHSYFCVCEKKKELFPLVSHLLVYNNL